MTRDQLVRRFGPPLLSSSVVTLLMVALGVLPDTSPWGRRIDDAIVAGLVWTSFLAAALMLGGRPGWTVRAIGIFHMTIGTGLLYVVIGWDGAPPGRLLDLIRANYAVGVPLFAAGLAWYAVVAVVGWWRRRAAKRAHS